MNRVRVGYIDETNGAHLSSAHLIQNRIERTCENCRGQSVSLDLPHICRAE